MTEVGVARFCCHSMTGWRERTSEAVAQLLAELPEADELPGFSADCRAATARYFVELVVLPMLMRAVLRGPQGAARRDRAHVAVTWRSLLPRAGAEASTDATVDGRLSSIKDNYFLLHSSADVLSMLEPIVWS
jgi:hypothetical protein